MSRRAIAAILVLTSASLVAGAAQLPAGLSPSAVGAVLFEEDFEDAGSSWWLPQLAERVVLAGRGTLGLTGMLTDARGIHIGDASWTDYVLTYSFRTAGGGFMLDFRWGEVPFWYSFYLLDRAYLAKKSPGAEGDHILVAADLALEWDHWYEIAVVVTGSRIVIYIDGTQIMQYVDNQGPSLSGGVNFVKVFDAPATHTVFLDNIVIREILQPVDLPADRAPVTPPASLADTGTLYGFPYEILTPDKSGASALLHEDFEGASGADWTREQDGWALAPYGEGNTALRAFCDNCSIRFGDPSWSEYALHLDTYMLNGAIEIRYQLSEDGHYKILIDPYAQVISVDRVTDGTKTRLGESFVEWLTPQELNDLTIAGIENYIAIYSESRRIHNEDDWLILEVEDARGLLPSGVTQIRTVKRSTYMCRLWLDNISVFATSDLPIFDETRATLATDGWASELEASPGDPDTSLSIRGTTEGAEDEEGSFLRVLGPTQIALAEDLADFLLAFEMKIDGEAPSMRAGFRQKARSGLQAVIGSYYATISELGSSARTIAATSEPLRLDGGWASVVFLASGEVFQILVDGELVLSTNVGERVTVGDLVLFADTWSEARNQHEPLSIRSIRLWTPDSPTIVKREERTAEAPGALLVADAQESFELWHVEAGKWEVIGVDGVPALHANAVERCIGTFRRGLTLEDHLIQFDIRVVSGVMAIRLRESDSGRYNVQFGVGEAAVVRFGDFEGGRDVLMETLTSTAPDEWCRLRVRLEGTRITVSIDDEVIWDGEDPNGLLSPGELSMEVCPGTEVWIREFTVWEAS